MKTQAQMLTEQNWHIPYTQDEMSLQVALDSIADVRTYQYSTPLMLQLREGAELERDDEGLLNSVDLFTHDCIHIVLGRGLLLMDELFCIGFTVASSKKVSTSEQHFYAKYGKHLFAQFGHLSDPETSVFRDAVRLAYISSCQALDKFDFSEWLQEPISRLRDVIGLEAELLLAYYAVEQSRFPTSPASRRLLNRIEQSVPY